MLRLLLILLLFNLHFISLAQKEDANWVFGLKAGINFSDTSHPANFITVSNNYEIAASISDSSGNLLFYLAPDTPFSIGGLFATSYSLFDAANTCIYNGSGLFASAQIACSAIIIPSPGQLEDYLVFSLLLNDTTINNIRFRYGKLFVSEIKKQGSIYGVSTKNRLISSFRLEGKMAIVKHANGKDWWLLTHRYNDGDSSNATNRFFKYLISMDSISAPTYQDIGILHAKVLTFDGQMTFSKGGDFLLSTLMDQNQAELFKFNRCTGELYDFKLLDSITPSGTIYGGEFSSNGKKVYLACEGYSTFINNSLHQYNLDTTDINSTKKLIWIDTFRNQSNRLFDFGQLRRAPDNKIYLALTAIQGCCPYTSGAGYNANNQYLWTINDPDSNGLACHFQPYSYYLGDSARSYYSLPNMPNYNLGPSGVYLAGAGKDTLICSGDSLTIGEPQVPGISYSWLTALGITDSTLPQQIVKPTQNTWYYVTLTDTTPNGFCGSRTDSIYVQLRVCCNTSLLSLASAGKDTTFCKEDSTIKAVRIGEAPVAGVTYTWQLGPNIDSIHKSIQLVRPDSSTWYYVTFSDSSMTGCPTRTDSVYVQVKKCDTVGISEITEIPIKVYPNPASSIITVEIPETQIIEFNLYDIIGQNVMKKSLSNRISTLDISPLSDGLYFFKIGNTTGKVQIIH